MTGREFVRRQLTPADRAKIDALPTSEDLEVLVSERQPLNASLTTLSGKTIGTAGLALLASSTSAVAINALGGSGGLILSDMINSLDAAKLTGTIDPARLPVIPGNNSISATTIEGLSSLQQTAVSLGTMVYTADGGAWRYSGSGSKVQTSSYYYTADVTPEWSAIANKPPFGSAAYQDVTAFAPAGITTTGVAEGSNRYFTEARVLATALAGFVAGTNTPITASNTVLGALQKAQAQLNARFDKAGGTISGDVEIQKSTPFLTLKTLLAEYLGVRLQNSVAQFEMDLSNDGLFRLVQRDGAGNFQRFAFSIDTLGVPSFDKRPTLGGVGFALQSELTGSSYKGTWNASTNSPAIVAGVGSNGDFYIVSVAGTQSITGSSTAFMPGDQVRFNGTAWQRIPNFDAVTSVNGQTGLAVLTKGDVGLSNVDNTSDANKPVSTAQQTALNGKQDQTSSVNSIDIGQGLNGDRPTWIDFHGYGAPNAFDYAARIIREGGTNGSLIFGLMGTGAYKFYGSGGMYYNDVALATASDLSAKADNFDTLDGGSI